MPLASDWRSPHAADNLKNLERPGFAMEFLRRNPVYRQDYARMTRRVAAGMVSEEAATAELAHRWGLSFPVRPWQPCMRRTSSMAPGTCS